LKSSRLGSVGRVLSVVADELTGSSGRTATRPMPRPPMSRHRRRGRRAGGTGTGQASGGNRGGDGADDRIGRSAARLADGLASALDALARDGVAVVKFLDDTAAGLAVIEQIDAAMREAAMHFTAVATSVRGRRSRPPAPPSGCSN